MQFIKAILLKIYKVGNNFQVFEKVSDKYSKNEYLKLEPLYLHIHFFFFFKASN